MVLKWIGYWFGGLALLCCLAEAAYPQMGEKGGLKASPTGSKTGKFGAWSAPAPPASLPDPVTLKLPGAVNQLIVGGAGKYLLAFIPGEQKLVVIDVAEAKLLKEISLGSDKAVIAANAEKLFVLLPEVSLLQRWNLETLERETSVPLNRELELKTLTVGYGSTDAPILAGSKVHSIHMPQFIDPKTLKLSPYVQGAGRKFACDETCIVRASSDGNLFVSTHTKSFPTGIFSLVHNRGKTEEFNNHTEPYRVLTNAAGDRIYTGIGQYGAQLQAIENSAKQKSNPKEVLCLPSITGDFWVKLFYTSSDPVTKMITGNVEFYLAGDDVPLATYTLTNAPMEKENPTTICPIDQQVMLIPDSKRFVVLDKATAELRLFPVDMDEFLKKSNRSYLFVSSRAPTIASAGKTYEYQLETKSSTSTLKYGLLSSPVGMTISPTGKIAWPVPTKLAGFTDVIVTLSNGKDQEIYHNFRVVVGDDATKPVPRQVASTTPAAAADPVALQLAPAKFAGATSQIKLPGVIQDFVLAAGGRFAVGHLKELQKLIVIDVVEGKIIGFIPVTDDQPLIAGSAQHIVLVQNTQQTISRYSLPDLRREISIPIVQPIRSIALGHSSQGPLLMLPKTEYRSAPRESILYDLTTLQPLELNLPINGSLSEPPLEPRASADGSTFFLPASSQSIVINVDGKRISIPSNYLIRGERMNWGLPNFDGSVFYSYSRRYSSRLQLFENGQQPYHETLLLLPATAGRLYLSVFNNTQSSSRNVEKAPCVYVEGNSRPLVKLPLDTNLLPISGDDYRQHVRANYDRRVALIPAAKVILSLNSAMDSLVLTRFDLDAELQAADIDYLFVDSAPPKYVDPDKTWTHKMTAKSKRGGVKFRLESGPPGMTIDDQGTLTWKVPEQSLSPARENTATKARIELDHGMPRTPAATSPECAVVLAISDSSEQVILHSFSLLVRQPEPPEKPLATKEPNLTTEEAAKLAQSPEAIRARLVEQMRANQLARQPVNPPFQVEQPTAAATPPKNIPQDPFANPATQPASPFINRIGETRVWTDVDSNRTVEAKFLGLIDSKIKVVKDNREFEIPLSRLSRPDLIWLLDGIQEKPAAKAQPQPMKRKEFDSIQKQR